MTLNNNILNKLNNFKIFLLDLIPIASNNTPQSDTTTGSSGSSLEYARSDHKHPKSTLYIDSAGTGLVKSNTTLSADIGDSTTTSSGKLVACNDSRLSDTRTPKSHEQATTTITNNVTYSNIGSNLTNQKLINDAINTKLSTKLDNTNVSTKTVTITYSDGSPSETVNLLYRTS